MKLIEVFSTKKTNIPSVKPRNFVAKNAKTSGSGSHDSKKFSRKEKHKNKIDKESVS